MKRWVQKLVEQLNSSSTDDTSKKKKKLELSEDRATLLYILLAVLVELIENVSSRNEF